jgi:hypothetical protein
MSASLRLAIAVAIVGLATSAASETIHRDATAHVQQARVSEALAKSCRDTSVVINGWGRDQRRFTYFDACLRRGRPF